MERKKGTLLRNISQEMNVSNSLLEFSLYFKVEESQKTHVYIEFQCKDIFKIEYTVIFGRKKLR